MVVVPLRPERAPPALSRLAQSPDMSDTPHHTNRRGTGHANVPDANMSGIAAQHPTVDDALRRDFRERGVVCLRGAISPRGARGGAPSPLIPLQRDRSTGPSSCRPAGRHQQW